MRPAPGWPHCSSSSANGYSRSMAQPRINAGKILITLAVLIAATLVVLFVINQLQARGLI